MFRKICIIVLGCVLLLGCQDTIKVSDIEKYEVEILEQSEEIKKLSEEKALLLEDYLASEREIDDLLETSENNEGTKHQYEINLEEEMDKWNGNTADGVEILERYGDLWKVEMFMYYDLLHDALVEEKKQQLELSQAAWESFYVEDEKLDYQTFDQVHEGGSIINLFMADLYHERYHMRAKELRSKFETLVNDY